MGSKVTTQIQNTENESFLQNQKEKKTEKKTRETEIFMFCVITFEKIQF